MSAVLGPDTPDTAPEPTLRDLAFGMLWAIAVCVVLVLASSEPDWSARQAPAQVVMESAQP